MSKRNNKTPKVDDDGSSAPKNPKVATESEENDKTENAVMSRIGKYFVMKQSFINVLELDEGDMQGDDENSKMEDYFGIDWNISIEHDDGQLKAFLMSTWPNDIGEGSMEVDLEFVLVSPAMGNIVKTGSHVYKNDKDDIFYGLDLLEWSKLTSDYLVDGKLSIEVHVKILRTNGLYQPRLEKFDDDTAKILSDIVLSVDKEQFYVPKLYLARQSPYFYSMFFGEFADSKKPEINLKDVDAEDFQRYLELLFLKKPIDDNNVEGILLLADMFDTQVAIRDCEDFLVESSEKTSKKKLQMSITYRLEKLKKETFSKIKTIDDIREVVLEDEIEDLDPSIMAILFRRAIYKK